MSTKRKQTDDAAAAAAAPPAKIHAAAAADAAAPAQPASRASKPFVEMSEEQRYMEQAYSVGKVTMPRRTAAAADERAPAPAAAAPAVDWSEAHRKFVNHGLAKWREVRSAWTGRDDKAAGAKRAAAAAAGADAASSTGAAAASPTGGKTALPHAPLARGRSRSKYADTSDEERAEGTDEDEFVAASSSDDDPNERDINADVPAILEAREHYQPFVPRVKLSHMVDILICIWEDEEE